MIVFQTIRQNKTPKGDGNSFSFFSTNPLLHIRQNKTPKGDGNVKLFTYSSDFSKPLDKTKPRKGTETRYRVSVRWLKSVGLDKTKPRKGTETWSVRCEEIRRSVLIRQNKTPKGDGNRLRTNLLSFRVIRQNKTPKGDGNSTPSYLSS